MNMFYSGKNFMSLNVKLFNESLKQMHLFPASLLECNKLQKLAMTMKRQAEQSDKKLGKGSSLQLTGTPTGRAGQALA